MEKTIRCFLVASECSVVDEATTILALFSILPVFFDKFLALATSRGQRPADLPMLLSLLARLINRQDVVFRGFGRRSP